jgi:hypothetical protein
VKPAGCDDLAVGLKDHIVPPAGRTQRQRGQAIAVAGRVETASQNDRKALRRARIEAAVGRAAVVAKPHRHLRRSEPSGSGRICQGPVRADGGLNREKRRIVDAHDEVHHLRVLVGRTALTFVAHCGTVCGPADCATCWSGPALKLGASFTGRMPIETVAVLPVSWPSLAV